jgi:hypothetical protein
MSSLSTKFGIFHVLDWLHSWPMSYFADITVTVPVHRRIRIRIENQINRGFFENSRNHQPMLSLLPVFYPKLFNIFHSIHRIFLLNKVSQRYFNDILFRYCIPVLVHSITDCLNRFQTFSRLHLVQMGTYAILKVIRGKLP